MTEAIITSSEGTSADSESKGFSKPHKCEECGQSFDRFSQLHCHSRSAHLGEKAQECEYCGKRFFRKTDLRTHLNIHLGTNVFICEVCGKGFNHISNFTRHSRSHKGEKPYPCSICQKRFTQISSLARHKRNHKVKTAVVLDKEARKIAKRQYYCKVCGETFEFLLLLKNHEKTHNRLYKCKICNKIFSRIESVKNHNCNRACNSESSTKSKQNAQTFFAEQCSEENSGEDSSNSLQFITRKYINSSVVSDSEMEIDISELLGTRESTTESRENIENTFDEEGACLDDANEPEQVEVSEEHNTCQESAPSLRLVQTETGEQFYELINFLDRDSSTQCHNKSTDKKSDEEDELFNEKSMYELFNNVDETEPSSKNKGGSSKTKENPEDEAPMVRLVQNEEGEQFFELVRDPVQLNKQSSHKSSESTTNDNQQTKKVKTKTPPATKKHKTSSKKFTCSVCDKTFSTNYNFKQHIGTHFSDQQSFQCKECGTYFAWKSTLNKHIANNHRPDGPQKFVCDICPKVYSTISQVNEHVKRDHLKERNHVCSHCGKTFFKKFDLKTHSRTHTNERPYICRACGKSFHHQSHIIRHERIHSGERPYSCDRCPKTFAQPGSLKSHKARHCQVRVDILDYQMDEDDPLAMSNL